MEIFKLFGSILMDTADADNSLAKTDESAKNVASSLGTGVASAAKFGAALVGGTALAVGGMVSAASSAAATADEIDKMSQKTGMSAQGYQEWAYIMGQNGMEIDKMQTGMKTLVAAIDGANGGNAAAINNFERLGVSIRDADGSLRSQDDVMNDTIMALADMENGTEKMRLATELFGKSGTEMMPMLNQGGQAIDDLRNRAYDLGLVMSDDAVKSGVVLGDTMDDVKQSIGRLATSVGTALMPTVQKASDLIIANLPAIRSVFESLTPVIATVFDNLLPPLIDLISTILPTIIPLIMALLPPITQIVTALLPVIVQLISTLLPPIIQIVQTVLPPLLSMLLPLLDLLSPLIELLTPILEIVIALLDPLMQILNVLLPPIVALINVLAGAVIDNLMSSLTTVANVIKNIFGNALDSIKRTLSNVRGAFSGLIDFVTGAFTGDWGAAWDGVKTVFSNVFDGLVNIVKTPINTIISGINGVFESIGNISIPNWVPGIGGESFTVPQIPMLARGGIVNRSTVANIGENGAEAVVPLEKNTQWIDRVATQFTAQVGASYDDAHLLHRIDTVCDRLDTIVMTLSQILGVIPRNNGGMRIETISQLLGDYQLRENIAIGGA